ncbi:OsmC family protein [Streptococcus dentasini]
MTVFITVSLLNVALASCVTMCIQGYFKRYENIDSLPIRVKSDLDYDAGRFALELDIDRNLTNQDRSDIVAYINEKCRVSKLLRENIALEFTFSS